MATPTTIKTARSERLIVPKSRLSYPHLFKPSAFQGEGEPKFSASFLVPKGEKDFIAKAKAAQEFALKELYSSKFPTNLERWGISDGDDLDDEAAKGCWVIKASNKVRPKVVDGQGVEVIDELAVYGGCYVRGSIVAKAYGTPSKGGVTFELLVCQKVADGEPFSGAARAMSAAVDELGEYAEEF